MEPPGKTGLLTAEEERRLAYAIRAGDDAARERLFQANVRLVYSQARRYHSATLSLEDLTQEGMLGLLTAVARFDPDLGYRFSTYAIHWIRQSIGRAIENKGRLIRIPTHLIDDARTVDTACLRLRRQLDRTPTVQEIAAETGLAPSRVATILDLTAEPVSLDAPTADGEGVTLLELLPDDAAEDPESSTLSRAEGAQLKSLIHSLRPLERKVIELRYGLRDGNLRSIVEVSHACGISREAARQAEHRAIRRLRDLSRYTALDDRGFPGS